MMALKLLGKNTSIYAVGNMVLRGVAFLLIPVFTHHLTVKEYGLLASLFITIEYLLMIMTLGMRNSLERFCHSYTQKNAAAELLGTTTLLNLFWGLVVGAICLLLLQPFFETILHSEDLSEYLQLVAAISLLQSLFLHFTAFYRAHNQATRFVVANVAAGILLVIANIIFLIPLQMGIKGALMAQVFSYGLMTAILAIMILRETGFKFSGGIIGELLQFGLPLIFSQSGQRIIGVSSVYILSFFAGLEAVGIYALGNKLARVLTMVLVLPFQMAFYPYIYSKLDHPGVKDLLRRTFSYFLFALALVSFAILVGARMIVPIIAPPEYGPAYQVILLLLPLLAFYGIGTFGEGLLNIVRKTYITAIVYGICGILSIGLNYLFIPMFDWYGVIITQGILYFSAGITLMIIGTRLYPVQYQWGRISMAGFMFLGFIALVFILQSTSAPLFYGSAVLAGLLSVAIIVFSGILTLSERKSLQKMLHAVLPAVGRR